MRVHEIVEVHKLISIYERIYLLKLRLTNIVRSLQLFFSYKCLFQRFPKLALNLDIEKGHFII